MESFWPTIVTEGMEASHKVTAWVVFEFFKTSLAAPSFPVNSVKVH